MRPVEIAMDMFRLEAAMRSVRDEQIAFARTYRAFRAGDETELAADWNDGRITEPDHRRR
jgi:hypothetical protein